MAWVVLGVLSLALLVSFGLILLLVETRWGPLLRLDESARDGLNSYALAHRGFVEAIKLISGSGSGVAWVVVLTPGRGVVALAPNSPGLVFSWW